MGIDPPSGLAPSRIQPILKARQPHVNNINKFVPAQTPVSPEIDTKRPIKDAAASSSNRRTSQAGVDRTGTLVSFMSINTAAGRVGMCSDQGPPIRGDTSTDVSPGVYILHADTNNKQWIFQAGQVKPGLRFVVSLEGVTDPFDLVYPGKGFTMIALSGFSEESFSIAKAELVRAVSTKQYDQAYNALDDLSEVDLYDMIDDLWLDNLENVNGPVTDLGTINNMLFNYKNTIKANEVDKLRVVRAIESFAVDRKHLYVDAFDECYVHPKSFSKNSEREAAGRTNIQLVFTYALVVERAIVLWADDITDSPDKEDRPWTYGECSLLYPSKCTAGTTPRMYAAKLNKIREIETQLYQFYVVSWSAVETVLNMVMFANNVMEQTWGFMEARNTYAPTAVRSEPGSWMPDNGTGEAAEYEAFACKKELYKVYRVENYNFDGYDKSTKVLLDAKYYSLDKGKRSYAYRLMKEYNSGTERWNGLIARHLELAEKQLKNAKGVPIEWRVSSEMGTEALQNIFAKYKIPIRVVYYPWVK